MSEFSEDCRQCFDWLVRVGVLFAKEGTETDVGYLRCLLQDGVVLCQLLNLLAPFSVDTQDYSDFPQMSEHLCLMNIRLFLQACRTVFKLREVDLFEPMDLYEMKNFNKVFNTLALLSQSDACQKMNLKPFYVKCQPPRYDKHGPKSFRDDYNNQTSSRDRNEGNVYGRLVDFQPTTTTRDPQPMSKRDLCIRELAVTEQNFIDALVMIQQYFMQPLKELLQPQDFDTIFSYIDLLHQVHQGFYGDLKKACYNCNVNCNINNHKNNPPNNKSVNKTNSLKSNNSNNNITQNSNTLNNSSNNNSDVDIHFDLSIPDCFIRWKESFLIYGSFCSNLLKSQNLLDEICAANPAVLKQVEKGQLEANEGRFSLRDLLSVPMQRVLKYHLFLKELIKNTERSHQERKSLQKALEEIQDLSLYVNEVKRDNDALLLLDEISRSIIGYQMPENISLKDYGRLINDGEVKLKAHSDHKTKHRYAFLFDKVLLFCKLKDESLYSFKSALVVSSFEIEDVNTKEKEKNFGFTFVLGELSMQNAYTIGCRSVELKNKWMNAIRTAQDNISPPHSHNHLHAFEMASFKQTTICDICRKLLKGLFYQGYLCQKTKMVVHKECIEKAKDMPGPPKPPPKSSHRLNKTSSTDRYPSSSTSPMIRTPNKFPLPSHDKESQDPTKGVFNRHDSNEQHPLTPTSQPHHLINFPWFMGCMSRDEASSRLEECIDGTFLLRTSTSDHRKGEFALSIKYGDGMAVKHIKVQRNVEGLFFIADSRIFKNIPDLVAYYERTSLQASFSEVPTTLLHPYKASSFKGTEYSCQDQMNSAIGCYYARYDFPAGGPGQLQLKCGDRVTVLSRKSEHGGWWKGVVNGKIGFFPSSFVVEADNDLMKFNEPLL